MYYVYIIQTEDEPRRYYTGFTEHIEHRLKDHNAGRVPHTAKFRPWRYKTYLAFSDREAALAFERYRKSHSGRAFAKKRL
jgi:predicted GIY-YIG superfamily endonuclease